MNSGASLKLHSAGQCHEFLNCLNFKSNEKFVFFLASRTLMMRTADGNCQTGSDGGNI